MDYKFFDISDRTISFNFSDNIDQIINSKIVEISYEINKKRNQFDIVSCYPTYNSLVIDYDPILVIGQVSEQEIKKITPGINGFAILSTGERLEGIISYVSKTADVKTRTFRIELEINNSSFQVKDGITAELFIPTKKVQAHLIPPSSLTLDSEGKIGVRHINSINKVIFSGVDIIGDEQELVWVTGLPEILTLITIGQEFVLEGQTVDYSLEVMN